MTRARLQQIYEAQLADALERRNEKGFRRGRVPAPALREPGSGGAVELEGADSRVWIWADLHLGDADALTFFGRPFRSVDDMDHLLVERWQSVIGPNDLVVCLGDVTRGVTSLPSLERLGGLPGRKVLVFGNHDRSAKGFHVVCGSVYTHGDPPLLLTHVPLRRVPPGCVNVHGHLHVGRVKSSTAHVNVSVEQLDYRPRRLTDIRRLAGVLRPRAVVAGPDDGPVAGSARRVGVRSR